MSGGRPPLVRVVAVQCAAGAPIPEDLPAEWRGADLVAFPEYWRCGADLADHRAAAALHDRELARLGALAAALDAVVVAGTIVAPTEDGALENRAYVFDGARLAGAYAKKHPMGGEVSGGIRPGEEDRVVEARGLRVGLLICSDVLFPGSFDALGALRPDVVVVPTSSPYRPTDTIPEKGARDRDIFVAGAAASGAYVVKVCALGPLFGHPLQGRSLVAAPWGVLDRVPFDREQAPFTLRAALDLTRLDAWRKEAGWHAQQAVPEK